MTSCTAQKPCLARLDRIIPKWSTAESMLRRGQPTCRLLFAVKLGVGVVALALTGRCALLYPGDGPKDASLHSITEP